VSAKAHSSRRNTAIAIGQAAEEIYGHHGVLIVRCDRLFDLVVIPPVCPFGVIRNWLRTLKLVIGGRTGNNVSVAGDLTSKPFDWASDLVDLRKADNAWEFGLGISRNIGCNYEYPDRFPAV